MSEQPPRNQPGLNGDQQVKNLQGIAPAVVDAFLNANAKKPSVGQLNEPPKEPPPEVPPSPRMPDSLGLFAKIDPESLVQRQLKIRHLALIAHEKAPAAEPPAPEPPTPRAPSGGLPPGDLRMQHLAMRKLPPPPTNPRRPETPDKPGVPVTSKPPGTPITGKPPNDLRLQHLAMRKGAGTGRVSEADAAKLEKVVGAALGAEGALALRQTIEALENKAMPASLTALTERVNALVPGSDGVVKLGADVGKRVLVNNLNPVLALSVAAKESAEKIDTLKKWNDLSVKERMATTAGLSANLAEILGAVTPPPVNFGAQVAAAGLQLVSLATEHSDTIEDVAHKAADAEPTRKVAAELSDRGAVLAHQVRQAWGELGERLESLKQAKLKPRAPAQLQRVFDSPKFKRMKSHPVTRNVATGFENLTYNLTARFNTAKDQWAHRIAKLREKGPER